MAHSASQMYYIAIDEAIKQGPRTISIAGRATAVFGLKKSELRKIFGQHGYNVSRRHAWIQSVEDWGMLYDAVIPAEFRNDQFNPTVVFTTLSEADMRTLNMYASCEGVARFPQEATA